MQQIPPRQLPLVQELFDEQAVPATVRATQVFWLQVKPAGQSAAVLQVFGLAAQLPFPSQIAFGPQVLPAAA